MPSCLLITRMLNYPTVIPSMNDQAVALMHENLFHCLHSYYGPLCAIIIIMEL